MARSKYHVTTSRDVMLGTIWRIVRNRRLQKGDITLPGLLTVKVEKTVGNRWEPLLEFSIFPRTQGKDSPTFGACKIVNFQHIQLLHFTHIIYFHCEKKVRLICTLTVLP